MSGSHVSRKEIDKQYRPNGYGLSPGLQRARAPFRTRNAITGLLISAFVVGVWAYSIHAVKQDTFDDLDEEAKALLDPRVATSAPAPSASVAASEKPARPVSAPPALSASSGGLDGADVRGVLASQLARHFPRALDPVSKTLVWGAPSVDRIGRLGDKNDRPS